MANSEVYISLELKKILLFSMKRISFSEMRMLIHDGQRYLEVIKEFQTLEHDFEQDVIQAQEEIATNGG